MDIEEIERRTREQIRDLQEDHQRRMAPLIKILSDIHMMRPITLPEAEYKGVFGISIVEGPEYQREQAEQNRRYRGMLDGIPVSKTRD